ncbi:uncharacterized protein [Pocillopora verrucosa]|uniref:uncharacterized protein n=1 Tax=Pocillopora verrucosa TaxID=203993 RepID=UPI0033400EEF
MKVPLSVTCLVLLLLPCGEGLSCYECLESSSWDQCTNHQEPRYCEPGWKCVIMKEKAKGKNEYYYRRTCSEESVCKEFCKDKQDCVYSCCGSDNCNKGEI